MIGATPLFSLRRSGVTEVTVHGEIVVTQNGKTLFQTSDALGDHPARSLLKPFQFLATRLPTKDLPLRHVTALGSVSATSEQVATIRKWFSGHESRFAEKSQVPAAFPMEERNRVLTKEAGGAASPWFHTCFCKHAAILEACEKNGWSGQDYLSPTHPFHAALVEFLDGWLGKRERGFVVDGCGLPSPRFHSTELATLFEKLIAGDANSDAGRVAKAMASHPEWVGGPNRVDTRHMQKNAPNLVAKEGADGLLGIGAIAKKLKPGPVGIFVKIAAGFYPELAAIAVAPILEALGLASSYEIPKGQEVHYHFEPFGKYEAATYDLSPTLSEEIAVWPGDVAFRRDVALDTNQGSHLTLSSLRTTVHVGTHTDAPNHFLAGKTGIDQASLSRYLGPCEVITVNTPRGGTISVADLKGRKLRTPRVLFRTGSFPNPNQFNEDFVAPSHELIEYLGQQGVCLIGIDTPSMDPFSSKELLAHKATAKWGLGILEGIVFPEIPDGIYELISLPLKIERGDASPVRVALRELR